MTLTPLVLTGFEHGFNGAASDLILGGGLAFGSGGSPTITTAAARNGSYGLEVNSPANTPTYLLHQWVSAAKVVARVAFNVQTLPTAAYTDLFDLRGSAVVGFQVDNLGHLRVYLNTSTSVGPTITTGTWHIAEFQADLSGTTWTLDWRVDGIPYTRATFASSAGALNTVQWGTQSTIQNAFDCYYDDTIVGTWTVAATDWWNDGMVLAQFPGSDGTHNVVADFSPGDGGAAYSGTVTNAYTMVDDPPGTNAWTTTRDGNDNLAMRVASATAYLEIAPTHTTQVSNAVANAVRAIVSFSSATTTANAAGCVARNSAGTATILQGNVGGTLSSYAVTVNNFKAGLVAKPAAGWTPTEVNAVRWRFGGGGSSVVTNPPTIQGLVLEVDWQIPTAVIVPVATTDTQATAVVLTGVYDLAVAADGPVLYVAEATPADSSGQNNSVAAIGSPTSLVLPNGDNAYSFDSTGTQYVEIPDSNAFSLPTTGSLTVECWMNPAVLNQPHSISTGFVNFLNKCDLVSGSNQFEWQLRMFNQSSTDGSHSPLSVGGYLFNIGGSSSDGFDYTGGLVAARWEHFVIAYKNNPSGYIKIYHNGLLVNTDATISVTPASGSAPVRIGAGENLTSFFQGALGKVAIYPTELSANRILTHYNVMIPATLPVASLQDTFNGASVNTTKWNLSPGTITVSSHALRELATTTRASIYSTIPYQLTGSSIYVQLTPLAIGNGTNQMGISLTNRPDGNSSQGSASIYIGGASGNIVAYYNDASGTEHDLAQVAPPASPCWVRISESGGTTYWDYSADAVTWTNLYNTASPIQTDTLYVSLWTVHGGTEVDSTAVFHNVNFVGVPITLAASATSSVAATVFTNTVKFLTPTAQSATQSIATPSVNTVKFLTPVAQSTSQAVLTSTVPQLFAPIAQSISQGTMVVVPLVVTFIVASAQANTQATLSLFVIGAQFFSPSGSATAQATMLLTASASLPPYAISTTQALATVFAPAKVLIVLAASLASQASVTISSGFAVQISLTAQAQTYTIVNIIFPLSYEPNVKGYAHVSTLGGFDSQLGNLSLAYDSGDNVVVTWIGMASYDNGTEELIFGSGQGGHPVTLFRNQPTILTHAQVQQAASVGAVLLVLDN